MDVLEKHSDYYLVRNTLGEQGLVPVAYIIQEMPSRKVSPNLSRKDSVPRKESVPHKEPVPRKESVPRKDAYTQPHPNPHTQVQPPVSSRRGSAHGSSIGDVPNFDPTPIPPNIPPPPPDIPKGWPYNKEPAKFSDPHRKKTKQQNLFEGAGLDIVKDLKKKRPLRKTTNTPKKDPNTPPTELALRFQKESPPDEANPSVKPITLASTKEEVLEWMMHYSYLIAKDRLRGMKGKDLVSASKEELRDLCGFGEGTRLYSHLQRESKGKGQASQMSRINPVQGGGEEESVGPGGVPKWLREHRDKVSGKGVESVKEEPSLWEQMQTSRAQADKLGRQRQKEEIWAKRRRAREQEERRESLEVEPPEEKEERRASRGNKSKRRPRAKDSSDADEEIGRERRGRDRRRGRSHRRRVSSERSEYQDSYSESEYSESSSESSYDSSDTSDSEYKREKKNKKKDTPKHSSPPATSPASAAPQFPPQPPGMYPSMAGPGGVPLARYPHPTQLGYLPPTPHMGVGMPYTDMMTQQMLLQQQQQQQQQVANAEQEAWNADMRLKQLRSQQAMGMSSPATMFASYPPHVTPMLGPAAPYGYSTFDRNYTSII